MAFDVFTNPVTATTTYTLVSVTAADNTFRNTGFTTGTVTITIILPPMLNITAPITSGTVLQQARKITATGNSFQATIGGCP